MTINIPLDSELAGLLQMFDRPLKDTARELIILELYRQGKISSGKAAELAGMPRIAFIQHASALAGVYCEGPKQEYK